MKFLAILTLLSTLGAAATVPPVVPRSYNLTLVLAGEGDAQYWDLTEENMPPGISSTELMFEARAAPTTRQTHQKRGSIECSSSHQADIGDCVSLLNALYNDAGSIPSSPRSIRYNNCYVSWSTVITGIRFQLYSAGVDVYNECNSNDLVSGLERDVNIGGTSFTQCLSNRATGCT